MATEVIEHELTLGSGVIHQLGDEGEYRGYRNPDINDDNYPVQGEGVFQVRFRLIKGDDLKRDDGWVYRSDFQRYCGENGLREPNAAKALLPPAKDKQLGRGGHPMVAFIGGSRAAFIVSERSHARRLNRFIGLDCWSSSYVFLAVCE